MIDHEGSVIGMTFDNVGSHANIFAISTILTCIEMWLKFRFAKTLTFSHCCTDVITWLISITSSWF